MLELPEVMSVARQLKENIIEKKICKVLPPSKVHKFCWYNGEPSEYDTILKGSKIKNIESFGIYVEIIFDNDYKLCFNDGVNVRLISYDKIPENYQLVIAFDDKMALLFTVAMYGGIILHDGSYDNEYYLKSKKSISPLSSEFEQYFYKVFTESKPTLSAKAFLATKQRFPGIGNGVLQDILFQSSVHPKRKINTLNTIEQGRLLSCVISVLQDMEEQGGRDTEKNIFGQKNGYQVLMSKNTLNTGCPKCGVSIVKETYLGGAVYYCPKCQKLDK